MDQRKFASTLRRNMERDLPPLSQPLSREGRGELIFDADWR